MYAQYPEAPHQICAAGPSFVPPDFSPASAFISLNRNLPNGRFL